MKTKLRTLLCTLAGTLCAVGVLAITPEADAHLRRGRELFDFGRWNDALHEFRLTTQALAPADYYPREEVAYYLAACAVETGDPDAEAALETFTRTYPESTYANDVRFALSSLWCNRGDMRRARTAFEQTDRSALNSRRREQYDLRMGYALFCDKEYEEAYRTFARIPDRSDYADHALYYRSYIDYAEGRNQQARDGFERLRASEVYRSLAPYYLLQLDFREDRYEQVAAEGPALAVQATPERQREIERLVAESLFRLGDYAGTLEHLRPLMTADATADREGCYLMGFSLYRTTRYQEAIEWLRKACGPDDALTQNASYHLADCYLHMGDKASAMQSFALASDERFDATVAEDALFNYAKLQYELGGGAFNGAINLLQRYLTTWPSSPRATEARTLLIAAYYNARNYSAAWEAIEALPSSDAEILAARQKIAYFRGLEAWSAGDGVTAQQALAQSVAVGVSARHTALATFWQGEIACTRGDYSLASAKYDAYLHRAPASDPEVASAWYGQGYCALGRNNSAQAEQYFNRFLKLHPQSDAYRADACNRLGDLRFAERKYAEAVAHYDQAIAIGGNESHYARYHRAMTLGLMGCAEQKQLALQQIVRVGQGDYVERSAFELGRSYIAAERYAEGARALEGFVERYPNSVYRPAAQTSLGLAWLNLGENDKALACYRQVVADAPRSAEARDAMQGIREIYVSRGEVDTYFAYAHETGMESDLSSLSRDSLSYVSAQKLYLAGDRTTAVRSLRSYLATYPKGYYRSDALYLLSDCYLKDNERNKAIETMTELSNEAPNTYTAQVVRKLGEMTEADGRYSEAATAWRKSFDAAPTAVERHEAMTRYVRNTLATGDASRIPTMAADVRAQKEAGTTARREATYAWAESLFEAKRWSEAEPLYKELATEVRSVEGSAAGYRLIEHQLATDTPKKVEAAIFAYSDREPRSYYLAKAYLLLGDLYLRQGDTFQARATWQSIADGYSPANDGIVDEAKARIAKLI